MLKRVINSSLFSGSAVYLFSNILAAAIPFALLPVLTRYLTTAEYGQVAIFQTLLAGLGAFVGLSVQGAAGVKYYDADLPKQELKYFIGNCFLVLAVTTALVLMSAVVFRRSLSDWLAIETHRLCSPPAGTNQTTCWPLPCWRGWAGGWHGLRVRPAMTTLKAPARVKVVVASFMQPTAE